MKARMLYPMLVLALTAQASDHHDDHHGPEASASEMHKAEAHQEIHKIAEPPKAERPPGPVVAMDADQAKSVRAGELYTAGVKPATLVARSNLRVELSPRSVGEFSEDGTFRLLRGSAVVSKGEETSVRTPGAKVDFVGKAIVSYDHHEKSSSAFVLEGEARMVNPHRDDASLKLARYRGATLVVGDVIPQMVRQLDVGGVQSWLAGFSWPAERRKSLLQDMPGEKIEARNQPPAHLEHAKIEDYFSSIDTADEQQQPDYYERKFDDPDKVVAEANSKQNGAGKALSPEEAALISLPKTQIDLGFELGPEFLTAGQKAAELARMEPKPPVSRGPASVAKAKPKAVKKQPIAERGDPDVSYVLERLRQVRSGHTPVSRAPEPARAPAAVREQVVADPVFDYSQNF